MREDQIIEAKKKWGRGCPILKTHDVARDQKIYQKELSAMAGIKNLPDVFYDMFYDIIESSTRDPMGFRRWKYTVIDDSHFLKEFDYNYCKYEC